jgi:hypothetical protein
MILISHLSQPKDLVQHSKYTLNPEKRRWGNIHYPSLNFSVPFCFSCIFIQQFHHHSPQITPLLLICVLMTKAFLCFNPNNPFPLIVMLFWRVVNIPRQSMEKGYRLLLMGWGHLSWKWCCCWSQWACSQFVTHKRAHLLQLWFYLLSIRRCWKS